MHRAKIVCTLGPATSSPERIRELVEAGMDVARLNMSHGTHADHERSYRLVREAADVTGHGVGISPTSRAQDPTGHLRRRPRGPEHRRPVHDHHAGRPGDRTVCGTTYDGLPGDVGPGDPILVDDGKVRLEVSRSTARTS